ncbi:fumarylacetoacetate hydrolase family protein [Ramlibacter sp.]|uniref:fumarylacetoacetate hydrolase family protein n=1 Tax=Ramlibacter sp. TaxID=1917967 RepID=UPI0035B48937
MASHSIESVATTLIVAREQQRPADAAPLADVLTSAEQAYAVQALVLRALDGPDAATVSRHWKSGGPSRTATLTHAPLPASGVRSSPADMRDLHFNLRLIEAEIALRLGQAVTPAQAAALTPETATALLDGMTVSIEVVDSRWQDLPRVPPLLKLADLQVHGALVLGAWVPFVARDWATQTCEVTIGTQAPQAFAGTHSLGDPAWLLPTWLRHATRHGQTVPAGTIVTTGTWCGMLKAAAGDRVVARFDGVGEASVQL